MNRTYRTDIDGIRAIAVISVILFHLGYLTNGYLGVDVFFVISGYLITGIINTEVQENRFSLLKFYEKRTRRIIPLVLFTTLIAFILGIIFMLPDDLENLSQSVFASNFSVNNILLQITSPDYWAVKNDYKPLMHTWSLGIEEQFYLLYPLIFLFFKGDKKKYILTLLTLLTIISLTLFLVSNDTPSKFYFLQYRFFELSIGGVCAIYYAKREPLIFFTKNPSFLLFLLSIIIYLLFFNSQYNSNLKVIIVTTLTAGILVIGGFHFEKNNLYSMLISNKLAVSIGKISFSLYMWHQIIFAFSRYFLTEKITLNYAISLSLIILFLSFISHFLIEKPFQNSDKISAKPFFLIVSFSFLIITSTSLYVHVVGGIIKDQPELGIIKANRLKQLNFFSPNNNINIQYNNNVNDLNVPFSKSNKIKILIIGDSFARDLANVILESSLHNDVEISYISNPPKAIYSDRLMKADFIFYTTQKLSKKEYITKLIGHNVNLKKLWIVGTKDFGYSNGIFYNRRKNENDCKEYRSRMKTGVLKINERMKSEWGNRYIDLIELVTDSNNKVLVFTPDCKFISEDTIHLTKFGAIFFAHLLDSKLREIIY